MSISEQVKELRKISKYSLLDEWCFAVVVSALNQAADTIESLSAKLQAENMKRSAESCGGWIPRSERLPEENEFVLVAVQLNGTGFKEYETCCGYLMNGKWYTYTERDFFEVGEIYKTDKVSAWQPLPDPYHEP